MYVEKSDPADGAPRLGGRLLGASVAWLGTAGVLVGCGADPGGSGLPRRVILITCDTLRADRLGAYGCELELTPNLDELAREGVVFDVAYATAPLTRPAVSALLTGRVPDEIGVVSNRELLPPKAETLAEVLSEKGIATAAVVSNWALRRVRKAKGAGVHQGFRHFDDEMDTPEVNRPNRYDRSAEGTTDAAIAWLKGRATDRFFLWVHYQDPHGPYTPAEEFVEAVDRPFGDEPLLEVGEGNEGLRELPRYQALGDARHPDFYRVRYDAEILYFDRELGRLLDWLRREGLYEDSLILFTADHGEALGEHDYWFSHGHTLFQELVRVPFLVRYPPETPHPRGEVWGGVRRVSTLVSHLDVWPTVLESFGLAPGRARGESLLAEEIAAERIVPQTLRESGQPRHWWSVTSQSYRLVVGDGEKRLYDMRADPEERNDVASSHPDLVAELERRLQEFLDRAPGEALERTEDPLDEETLRGLKALGYGGE